MNSVVLFCSVLFLTMAASRGRESGRDRRWVGGCSGDRTPSLRVPLPGSIEVVVDECGVDAVALVDVDVNLLPQ